jgi:thiol-disulfide isomerase/thioredoxin
LDVPATTKRIGRLMPLAGQRNDHRGELPGVASTSSGRRTIFSASTSLWDGRSTMARLRFVVSPATVTIVFAIVAVVITACASRSMSEPSTSPRHTSADATTQPIEARTVPVKLRFIAKTLDGQEFHGQDLLGKAAVLWFWVPSCPVCQNGALILDQVAASRPDVNFVGVAGLDQVRAIKEFVKKYPMKRFTQLADTDGSVWANFGVTQQPAFAFIRPNGGIDVVNGPLSERDLMRRANDLASQ